MYNRYIPPGTAYAPIPEEESDRRSSSAGDAGSPRSAPPGGRSRPASAHASGGPDRTGDLLGSVTKGIGNLLGGVFQNFSLQNLDSGDILLILIILFLFLEGDNLDLVIALGLMLLLGLGESEADQSPA